MIDLHCDTVLKLIDEPGTRLDKNIFAVDLNKLSAASAEAQFFALFIDRKDYPKCFQRCEEMLHLFRQQVKDYETQIAIVTTLQELEACRALGKIGAFLTIEEGAALGGSMEALYHFYNQGIRLITLTWNYPNEIGWPHLHPEGDRLGLTHFGRDVVSEMQELGMLVDVSHLSDRGFYDVAETAKRPFIASHSNCRAVTEHSRNLTDPMIRLLAEKGGVMGINFASSFLGDSSYSRITDMIRHIKHMKQVGGIDVIALGTDFDGIDCSVEIEHIGEIAKLWSALEKNGFTVEEIEKISWRNAKRVLRDVLK